MGDIETMVLYEVYKSKAELAMRFNSTKKSTHSLCSKKFSHRDCMVV